MKKYLYLIIASYFILNICAIAQTLSKDAFMWGNDNVVLNYDPLGTFSGVQDSDGKIYVAVKDKVIFPGGGISIISSDDNGVTWNILPVDNGIVLDGDYRNFKLVQGPENAIYLFAQIDNMLSVKRIDEVSGLWASQILMIEYDVVYSDLLNKFILLYVQSDNNLYFREIEFQNGYFSSGPIIPMDTGVNSPKLAVDGTKIGISFMYNHFVPKESSPIVHYAGEIAANKTIGLSNPVNAVSEGSIKTEYKTALVGDKVWIVYVERNNNQMSVKGNFSLDGGYAFSIPQNIALAINSNNYWLNLKKNKTGFDLVFYSDQPQTGSSTNETDKIVYAFNAGTSSSFIYNQRVSSHFPFWSGNNQIPEIIPLTFSQSYDVGVLWIGYDPAGIKLFWNRFSSITDVGEETTIPAEIKLSYNYPNPFNPSTTINYQLTTAGYVTLKVYDVLGSEVATLVNEYQQAGTHNCEWRIENGEIPSGVYFYQINSGNYSQVKKMILAK